MLKPIILDDFSWQKLEVMSFFSQLAEGTYSINTISNALELSYTAGSTLVSDIHSDLLDIYNTEFLTSNGKIQWHPKLYQHNEYIQYLLRKSINYNFVLETLLNPSLTFPEFCQKFYLSQSTVLRKLKPLKDYLQRFQLKVTPSKMNITGRESLIRMFYTVYLWAGHHGLDIINNPDFPFKPERELMANTNLDKAEFMHPQEIFLRLAVNRLRYDQGHELSLSALAEFPFNGTLQPVAAYCRSFINDEKQQAYHARFLCYMLYFTPFYINIDDYRVKEINGFYKQLLAENHPIAVLTQEYESFLYGEVIDSQKTDYEESFLLHINIFVTLVNYQVHRGDAPMIMDIARATSSQEAVIFNELKQKNQSFVRKITRRKDFAWLVPAAEDLITDLTFTILPTYKESLNHEVLNVALLTTPDYWVNQTLKELLKQFQFVKIHHANFDDPNIDFFLTTFERLLPKHLEKPYYVVQLVREADYEKELFDHLWEAYKHKLMVKSWYHQTSEVRD